MLYRDGHDLSPKPTSQNGNTYPQLFPRKINGPYPMIIRTEAIVLRVMKYRETSQIVTLFTREKGKMAVMAKGARLLKSRFGSSLQPMSYTQVVFYHKPTRGIQTLSESAHVQFFHGISRNLEKISIGLRIVELIYALMPEEEQNPQVFNLLVEVLGRLDEAEAHAINLLPYFQMRLGTVLGFAPDIDRDMVQHLPDEGGVLALDTGAILLPDAALDHPDRSDCPAGDEVSRDEPDRHALHARERQDGRAGQGGPPAQEPLRVVAPADVVYPGGRADFRLFFGISVFFFGSTAMRGSAPPTFSGGKAALPRF